MRWPKGKIVIREKECPCVEPLILSASRRSDIPAFHADWFFKRMMKGWFEVPTPFNPEKISLVSARLVRFVVFWTKDPEGIIGRLGELDRRDIGYYFLYTLNDYEKEGWEPGLAKVKDRIDIFIRLSEAVGPERVLWRFDPLAVSGSLGLDELLERVFRIGRSLKGYTKKMIFSFLDRECYPAVKAGFGGRELTIEEMEEAGRKIAVIARECGLEAGSCSEEIDLSKSGIGHNSCIDEVLIRRLSGTDAILMDFLDRHRGGLKDTGQRKSCCCIVSRDIGTYSTCGFRCKYCYASRNGSG